MISENGAIMFATGTLGWFMRAFWSLVLLPVVLLFMAPTRAFGQSQSSGESAAADAGPQSQSSDSHTARMSKQTRLEIIRDFETQLFYARTAFPMGNRGLKLKDGLISPNGEQMRQEMALWGPAVKPGDPAHISFVQIKEAHIHFEINGGPTHHKKWYQRVEVTGAYGTPVTGGSDDAQANPHGTFVDLYFDKHVPEMTV